MKKITYFTLPTNKPLMESIPASKWSAGFCLTQDKTIAGDLAGERDNYLYKCLVDDTNIKEIRSLRESTSFRTRESLKL